MRHVLYEKLEILTVNRGLVCIEQKEFYSRTSFQCVLALISSSDPTNVKAHQRHRKYSAHKQLAARLGLFHTATSGQDSLKLPLAAVHKMFLLTFLALPHVTNLFMFK